MKAFVLVALLGVSAIVIFQACASQEQRNAREKLKTLGIRYDDEEAFIAKVKKGDSSTVMLFCKAGMDPDRGNALILAIAGAHPPVASVLIKAGANPNYATQDGLTVLMAASAKGYVETVRELISAGAKTSGQDGEGALRWAEEYHHPDVVEVLRSAGAGR